MAIIPVADGVISMKAGSHSYNPVRKDAGTVVIPCVGAFTTATSTTTRLAAIILPVENEKEAADIAKSVRKKFGPDTLSLSFKKSGKTWSYAFAGKDGLALAK